MKIIDVSFLKKKEKEIVMLILSGKNKREIADKLLLSVSTIKSNVENIFRKFNVHNKAELIVYVIKNKIVDLEDNI